MDDDMEYANTVICLCCALLLFAGLWCFISWQAAAVISVFVGMITQLALED